MSTMSAVLSTAAAAVGLVNPGTQTYSSFVFNGTATSGIRIATDGKVYELTGAGASEAAIWLRSGTASVYEVRYTVVSGTIDSGTTGVYLAISTDRDVSIQTEFEETDTAQLTVHIRHATNTSNAIQFTANLSAQQVNTGP